MSSPFHFPRKFYHPPSLTALPPSLPPFLSTPCALQGAMFEVSEWLLVVDNINKRRLEMQNR